MTASVAPPRRPLRTRPGPAPARGSRGWVRLAAAVPAVVASGLAALLPDATRPAPVLWVVGTAVLVGAPCLLARRRAGFVGLAGLGAALGMLAQLRLGVPAGYLGLLGLAASALLVVGLLAGRADRVAGRLEDPACRRLVALAALAAGLLLRAVTVLGPAPASGTLPLLGVQVGELTRYLVAGGAALALAEPTSRLRPWSGVDRRFLTVAGVLAAAGVATLVVLGDGGPAVLVVAGTTAAAVHAKGLRARWVAVGATVVAAALPLMWTASVLRTRVSEIVAPGRQLSAALTAAWSGGLVGPGPGRSPLVDGVPAIGSDYALAALVADLGVLVVLPVLLALLIGEAHLVRAAASRTGPSATLAVAVATLLTVQAAWNALGTVAVLPLTGLNQPFLGISGTSVTTSALALGLVLGILERRAPAAAAPGTVPVARAARVGVRVVAVLLVAASVLLAVGPRAVSDPEQVRMPRGTVWTADGAVISTDAGAERVYPAGGRYADLGFQRRLVTHRGLDAVEAATLTCGGHLGPLDALASVLHPVCRPADVVTTVDARVQEALGRGVAPGPPGSSGSSGEAVLLDARTGSVLGLYSSAATGPDAGSQARAHQGPPGSTMKIVTAAAALMGGVDFAAAPATTFSGGDGRALGNDDGATCPATDAATALARSCNSVYGWAAARVGPVELERVAREYFGADQRFRLDGLDVAGLDTGLDTGAPGAGALARTGIGQESVRSSVLGVALATAVVARSVDTATAGVPMPWPHLVGAVCAGGGPELPAPPTPVGTALPRAVGRTVVDGMHQAVSDGTARRLVVPPGRDVAVKTGTAQLAGGGVDSWVTAIVDGRYVLTLVVHRPVDESAAVDAASRTLAALPSSAASPTCTAAPER